MRMQVASVLLTIVASITYGCASADELAGFEECSDCVPGEVVASLTIPGGGEMRIRELDDGSMTLAAALPPSEALAFDGISYVALYERFSGHHAPSALYDAEARLRSRLAPALLAGLEPGATSTEPAATSIEKGVSHGARPEEDDFNTFAIRWCVLDNFACHASITGNFPETSTGPQHTVTATAHASTANPSTMTLRVRDRRDGKWVTADQITLSAGFTGSAARTDPGQGTMGYDVVNAVNQSYHLGVRAQH